MPVTTPLNGKANVKLPTQADISISGRKIVSLEELQVSTAGQSTIIIGTFAVDVNNVKNLLVIIDGKILTEGSGNDFTLTNVSANNTSNTITLSNPIASPNLNIKLLYLGVVVTNSTSMDTLSPAMSDWVPFSMVINATTPPTRGAVSAEYAFWRRVGDSMEIVWSYRQSTGGSGGSGTYYFMVPQYSIDYNKVGLLVGGSSVPAAVGSGLFGGGSVTYNDTLMVLSGPAGQFPNGLQMLNGGTPLAAGDGADFSETNISYTFFAKVPIAGWSANVIAQGSSIFQASAFAVNGTNVTSTPTTLGQYRTYTKNASALTGTDNAPTGSFLPSNSNGFQIDGSVPYTSAGTSGQPNRWEIFIGHNMYPTYSVYSGAGRTGAVSLKSEQGSSTTIYGVNFDYDPTSGIVFVDAIDQATTATTRNAARSLPINGGAAADLPTIYFDINVSENVLPVQYSDPSKVAKNEVTVDTGNGFGSTNTTVRRFSVIDNSTGTAITYADDPVNGGSFTINEAGIYAISYSDSASGGASFGVTVNSTALTTNIRSISYAQGKRIVGEVENGGDVNAVSWTGNLSVGDIVRAQQGTGLDGTDNNTMFTITKIANG